MESLSLRIEPAETNKREGPLQRPVTEPVETEVPLPQPASLPAQLFALVVLIALAGAGVYLLIVSDSTGAVFAGAVILLFAGFLLALWATSALALGLGPKQLLEILLAIIEALGNALGKRDDEPDQNNSDQPPATQPHAGQPPDPNG